MAAVFVEPVMGAGGAHQPRPDYVEGVAELCARHGALFVADAVICAFGRLGTWFGVERFGVRPDLLCFAKGVTSGYLPLGGVVASGRVAEPFWDRGGIWFRHGATYAGPPTCCAAAMANLDLLEGEGLMARGQELEDVLAGALRPLAGHELVGEVRAGIGAIAAVALPHEALAAAAPPARPRVRRGQGARRARAPARRRGRAVAAARHHAGRDQAGRGRDRGGARRRGAGARGRRRGAAGGRAAPPRGDGPRAGHGRDPLDGAALEVAPADVQRALDGAGAQVVDVREPYEREAGYIPGTLHVALAELSGRGGAGRGAAPRVRLPRRRALAPGRAGLPAGGLPRQLDGGRMERWAAEDRPIAPEGGVVAPHRRVRTRPPG